MGTYVYAVKKSKPYTIKGMPPIHRLEYVCKPYWDADISKNRTVARVTQAWGESLPELIAHDMSDSKKNPIMTAVHQNPKNVIWWDCDPLPGTPFGWLMLNGKKKRFLTLAQMEEIVKKTTGFNSLKEMLDSSYKTRNIGFLSSSPDNEVIKAFCNNYSFSGISFYQANEQIPQVI